MLRMHACIFSRFTRKMHGNDTMLESGCLALPTKKLLSFFLLEPRFFGVGLLLNSEIATSLRSSQ